MCFLWENKVHGTCPLPSCCILFCFLFTTHLSAYQYSLRLTCWCPILSLSWYSQTELDTLSLYTHCTLLSLSLSHSIFMACIIMICMFKLDKFLLTAGTKFFQNKTLGVESVPLEILGGRQWAEPRSYFPAKDFWYNLSPEVFNRGKQLRMCQGKEFVVFSWIKMNGGGRRNQRRDGEDAKKMKSCLRLDGTSEQHRGCQKHFANAGSTRKSQSPRCCSASIVKRAPRCSQEFMWLFLMWKCRKMLILAPGLMLEAKVALRM